MRYGRPTKEDGMEDERCEYCGTADRLLSTTSDGAATLCDDCRSPYEAELSRRETSNDA